MKRTLMRAAGGLPVGLRPLRAVMSQHPGIRCITLQQNAVAAEVVDGIHQARAVWVVDLTGFLRVVHSR